jgi:hypothetical protein
MPAAFSLNPSFFAGDPIESASQPPKNRLTIRMQRNGTAVIYNDTLYFDILDSFQVARCVRGSTLNDPAGDWDKTDMGLGPWCDWTGAGFGDGGATDGGAIADGGVSPDGGTTIGLAHPRIRLTSQGYVQASLALLGTCPLNPLTGQGAALVAHSVDGWIEFIDFGNASEPTVDAGDRPPVINTNTGGYRVNFGERLRANFHIVMQDDRVLTALETGTPGGPVPDPLIGATLDGSFDFDFVRGRAAQPFP